MRQMRNVSVACLVVAISFTGFAQQHPNQGRGFDPAAVFSSSGIDHVNVFNSNLVVNIPLGQSYPVNAGMSYQLALRHTGNVWDYDEVEYQESGVWVTYVQALPNRRSNAGTGWLLSLGRLILTTDPTNESGLLQYESPDGSNHAFYSTLHGEAPATNIWYTRDGTYLRLKRVTTATPNYYELEFPNGQRHKFRVADGLLEEIIDRFGNYVRVVHVFAADGSMDRWTITDGTTAGVRRTHTVEFRYSAQSGYYSSVVDYIDVASFNGTTARYTFSYESRTIARGHGDTDPYVANTVLATLLSTVTFPDGSSYGFTTYDALPGSGHLDTMTLPTLGKLRYTYGLLQMPASGRFKVYRQHSIGVTSRKTLDENGAVIGTWSYTHTLTPEPICFPNTNPSLQRELKKEITDPALHKTVHYFSVYTYEDTCPNNQGWSALEYAMPLTRKIADPLGDSRYLSTETYSNSGALKKKSYVRYERDLDSFAPPELENTNRRLASERIVFADDADRYSEMKHTDFDGLGQYRQTKTEGNHESYASELNPANLAEGNRRTEYTNFNPGYDSSGKKNNVFFPATTPWILNTFDYQLQTERDWVSAPAGPDVTARQEFCFEASTGYLQRRRALSSTSRQGSDLLSVFTRDTYGNTIREESFGGDRNTAPSATTWCTDATTHNPYTYRIDHEFQQGALKGSWYVDQAGTRYPFKIADYDIDQNTGMPVLSRSAAQYSTAGALLSSGVITNFEYDSSGRLTWSKPATTPIANGAWTQYLYTRAMTPTALAQIEIIAKKNGGVGDLTKSQILYDAFGRIRQEKQLLPDATLAWNRRQTTYNSSSQKATVSEVVSDSAPPNPLPITSFAYDHAGRPVTVTPPDCAAHAATMSYTGARVVSRTVAIGTAAGTPCVSGETSATTQEHYDRQGRLWKVVEPNGTVTKYAYDIGNRLKLVNMAAQIRTFTYDRRGLLLTERHPEVGSLTYPDIVYSNYDARGHYGNRRVGAPGGKFDLAYAYDRAERLVRITETTAQLGHHVQDPIFTAGLLKEYTYWPDNSGSDIRVGKVKTARRVTWIDQFQAVADTTETYNYAGRDGRPSYRETKQVDWFTYTPPPDGRSTKTFTQTFSWNDLGDAADIRYPQCLSPITYADGTTYTCPASPRTIALPDHIGNPSAPAYRNGAMVAVPGYGSLYYHPNMMVRQVTLASGPAEYIENDPNSMRRPRRIYTTGFTSWSGGDGNYDSGYYEYDGAGNIRKMGSDTFLYDVNGRLTQGNVFGGTAQQAVSYDAFGNIQSMTVSGATRTLTTSSATNRLSIGGVAYDEVGNLTQYGSYTYSYDSLGMLTGMVGPPNFVYIYAYTADEERLRIYNNYGWSKWRIRDLSNRVLREYGEQSGWYVASDFIHRQDGLPLVQLSGLSGYPFPLALDHLGSIRRWGTYAYTYFPFGEVSTTGSTQTLQFAAHEHDQPTAGDVNALDYMHARSYFPVMGRFLSVDPAGFDLTKPQSFNRYSYVLNNPIKYNDPDGRTEECPTCSTEAIEAQVRAQAAGGDEFAMMRLGQPIPGLEKVAGPAEFVIAGVAMKLAAPAEAGLKFASEKLLQKHFKDHAAEVGAKTSSQYLKLANDFVKKHTPITTRANGDKLFYNRATNEFAVVTKDGVIRTYFKPERGIAYAITNLINAIKSMAK